ncbi:MAG: HAD-IA family hydrolase [Nitratireductor sp.]|nr:HAD-IA family hydrolase [Nitratireductor sp.]
MPSNTRPTLVLDLDGTLADTNRDLVPVLNRVIGAEGLQPVAFADIGHIVGLGAKKMIERAYEFRGVPLGNAKLDQLFDAFLSDYEQNMAVNTVLYDGVEGALERFANAGWQLAICTNKQEAMARKLVAELGVADYFAAIAGGNTFPVRKPDPRHLTGTVEQAGGNPARTVMVGDSITDISAARAASIPVVAVDFGYSDKPIREYSPDHVISHYDELWETVARIAANWV